MIKRNPNTIAVGPIGLNVSDIDVSEGFYQEVLGLRVAEESLRSPFKFASMARDGKTVLTLWEKSGEWLNRCRPGLDHLSFEADSVEAVNRTKGLLDNVGASWSEGRLLNKQVSRSAAIHFKDPDGVRIEVYSVDHADKVRPEASWIGVATAIPELSAISDACETMCAR